MGLKLCVFHPDSMKGLGGFSLEPCDGDGHHCGYHMGPMRGEALAEVSLRRGISAATAAAILRKLADRVEQAGPALLNLRAWKDGWFDERGEAVANPLSPSDRVLDNGLVPPFRNSLS